MKYHVVFDRTFPTNLVFDTPEEAFKAIPVRAKEKGNHVTMYQVICRRETGPDLILTTPPVSGTVQLDHTTNSANPKQAFGDKKLQVGLVPRALTLIAAPAFKEGARKYGPYNWRTTKVEAMTYIAAIERHLAAYLDGEDVDPESTEGKTHLGGIAACVAILADAEINGQLIDNRPPKAKTGEYIRTAAGVAAGSPTKDSK